VKDDTVKFYRLGYLLGALVLACGAPQPKAASRTATNQAPDPSQTCTRIEAHASVRAALLLHEQSKFQKTIAVTQDHLDAHPTDEVAAALWRVAAAELSQARVDAGNALMEYVPIELDDVNIPGVPASGPTQEGQGGITFGPDKGQLAIHEASIKRRRDADPLTPPWAIDGLPTELDGAPQARGSGGANYAVYTRNWKAAAPATTLAVTGLAEGPRRFVFREPRPFIIRHLAQARDLLIINRFQYPEQFNADRVDGRAKDVTSAFDANSGTPLWKRESAEMTLGLVLDGHTLYALVEGKDGVRLEVRESATAKLLRSAPVAGKALGFRREGGQLMIELYGNSEREVLVNGRPLTPETRAQTIEMALEHCQFEQALAAVAKRDESALVHALDVLSPITHNHALMDALRKERTQLNTPSLQEAILRPVPSVSAPPPPPAKTPLQAANEPRGHFIVDEMSTRMTTADACRDGDPCYFGLDDRLPALVPRLLGTEALSALLPAKDRLLWLFGKRYLVVSDKQAGVVPTVIDWNPDAKPNGQEVVSAALVKVLGQDVLAACLRSDQVVAYAYADLSVLWQTRPEEPGCLGEIVADDHWVYSLANRRDGSTQLVARTLNNGAIALKREVEGSFHTLRVRDNKLRVMDASAFVRSKK
jgi:hypothetical protein